MLKLLVCSLFVASGTIALARADNCPEDAAGSCTMIVRQNGLVGVEFKCQGHCFGIGSCAMSPGAIQNCKCAGAVTVTACTGQLTTIAGETFHSCIEDGDSCPGLPVCKDHDFDGSFDPGVWPNHWVTVCCCK